MALKSDLIVQQIGLCSLHYNELQSLEFYKIGQTHGKAIIDKGMIIIDIFCCVAMLRAQ